MVLMELVGHYSRLGEMRRALEHQHDSASRLGVLLEHIQRHYDEPIRVTDAARLCAMSACCFHALFEEATGQSFVAYLNRFRVTTGTYYFQRSGGPIAALSINP